VLVRLDRRLPQFTLRSLFIGVAVICAILGFRQLNRQYYVDRLWNQATKDWKRDDRVKDDIYESAGILVPDHAGWSGPCFICRVNDGTRRLIVVQISHPKDETLRYALRITMLGKYGKVISTNDFSTGPGFRTIEDAEIQVSSDGRICLVLRNSFLDEPLIRPSVFLIEQTQTTEMKKLDELN